LIYFLAKLVARHTSEVQYSPLPKYRPAAQLLTVLREQHLIIQDYKPLVIGVHDTVRTRYPLFSRTAVRLALKFHAHSLAYLKNLAAGGYRYDLRGEPWGLVTLEHQRQAQEKLTTRRQVPTPKRHHPAAQRSRTLPPWKPGTRQVPTL
jgi:hypothetical protein